MPRCPAVDAPCCPGRSWAKSTTMPCSRFSACQMLSMEDMPLITTRLCLLQLCCSTTVLGAAVSTPVASCLRIES